MFYYIYKNIKVSCGSGRNSVYNIVLIPPSTSDISLRKYLKTLIFGSPPKAVNVKFPYYDFIFIFLWSTIPLRCTMKK